VNEPFTVVHPPAVHTELAARTLRLVLNLVVRSPLSRTASDHYTPKSASWLNAVEGFFAKLTKRRLKRGVFRSLVDLQAAIKRFVADTNATAKPFVWTANPDKIIAAVRRGYQVLCVDDPVEARAIWYVAPRSGAVMCPAYVARS